MEFPIGGRWFGGEEAARVGARVALYGEKGGGGGDEEEDDVTVQERVVGMLGVWSSSAFY